MSVGSAIVIRDFEPRDQVASRALIITGLGEHFGHVDESLNPDLDDIAANYAGADLVVAEKDGQLVGTGFLKQIDDRNGEVVRMAVAPDARRTGVGRLILDELLRRARDRRYATVTLSTLASWDAAPFYRSCGFSERQRVNVALGEAIVFEMKLTS